MPNPRVTQIIAELPFEKKIVGVASILMIVGLFFPWYQDLDSFRTGDTFTGLTGPMYLVGFTFLVISSASLLVMVMDYFDKKLPLFKVKGSKLHLWSGIVSFYLLFLVGSVYFHPAFGVNITLKQSGFGMFMAYAAAALLTIGGYLEGRGKAAVKEFEKETREESIEEVVQPKPIKAPVMATKVVHPMMPEQRKRQENLRNMHQNPAPVQQSQAQQAVSEVENSTPVAAQQPVTKTAMPAENVQPERKAQPYRMDL